MKPKLPEKCPYCGKSRGISMIALASRVFTTWTCTCGGEWTADAASGRLISRKSHVQHIEGERKV